MMESGMGMGTEEHGNGNGNGSGKSYKESLKALEADIQHANTLALEFPREYDGARMQLRLSYSPVAPFLLFLVQWTDCSLAGALGLLRVLSYKIYRDGTSSMSIYERKASLREFYGYIYPCLQQLEGGVTDMEDVKQKTIWMDRYQRECDTIEKGSASDIDIEREQECNICMEVNNTKIVLPDCNHAMCMKCYRDWRQRSQSCPFCRSSLKRVNSMDLWILTNTCDVKDMATLTKENVQRLFKYVDNLPLVVTDNVYSIYDAHLK